MEQSNRHHYDIIKKKGKKFIYSIALNYFQDALGAAVQSTCVPIPLFAPNMFETFYNEVTNNMGMTKPTGSDINVGIATYGASIWDALASVGGGPLPHTSYYPYNGPDIAGVGEFWSNEFFMKIANGSILGNPDTILSGWIKISSVRMAYLNMMRTLQTKKVLCTNINFQWTEVKLNESQIKWNPLVFFDQQITGELSINETTIGRNINPVTNVNSRNLVVGLTNYNFYNVDVPCDWIFSASSGVSIGWDCLGFKYIDKDNPQYMTLNFTFEEVQ